jgi:hypothetical protein
MEIDDDKEYFEEEGEVDLIEEPISSLEELRKKRKENKSLKEELKTKNKAHNLNSEEVEQMIKNIKVETE